VPVCVLCLFLLLCVCMRVCVCGGIMEYELPRFIVAFSGAFRGVSVPLGEKGVCVRERVSVCVFSMAFWSVG